MNMKEYLEDTAFAIKLLTYHIVIYASILVYVLVS